MLPRLKWLLLCVALLSLAAGEDTPPGLVAKDNEQDLQAEATQTGQAQKREAGLHNSYGEPLPPDAYGPPQDIVSVIHGEELDLHHPAPVYGVPDLQTVTFQETFQETPPGAYGPPSPIVFPSQTYEGPPPPVFKSKPTYGPPKYHPPKHYGPPKLTYGPPKLTYGPPKKIYGPPKPKYGVPKPPKIISKPVYGPPKLYGPPKPVYGPPKVTYGVPNLQSVHIQELPVSVSQDFGAVSFNNVHSGINIDNNVDLFNLPAPIYGTPLISLPGDLKPNFPIPADTYGPPGQILGPEGHSEQVVVEGISNVEHYGPPQPDPNPRPPHPGIPAPPTPPHVLYDGWKPIPGLSVQIGHVEAIGDQYGPPPPPPVQEIHFEQGLEQNVPHLEQNLPHFEQNLPHLEQHQFFSVEHQGAPIITQNQQFSNAQITTGYSSVHQDALANVDIGAIVGGDSNNIDQAKTVFEAHYTENHPPRTDLTFIQPPEVTFTSIHPPAPEFHDKPIDTYSAPPLDSFSTSGPYPASIRQHGAKGLIPPSGIYGVPPGSYYGEPPKPPPAHLPIPYGSVSGGHHSGGHKPIKPIKFREPVPAGLLQHVGQTTHGKDSHGIDHLTHGPSYLPPPIENVKKVHENTEELTTVSYSIEPTNLYSLPHVGHPLTFNGNFHHHVHGGSSLNLSPPSNLYGSPIDSYSVPLLTVGDHTASGSSTNSVTTTLDGSVLANLSNLDAAAILKHCPYHEAILKAAQNGEKIPADLASKYLASLNSLGASLSKNQISQISSEFGAKDLSTSSHTVVQTVVPNDSKVDLKLKSSRQTGKQNFKDEKLHYVSDQIFKTSQKIKNLSDETKQLQQKIASSSQNLNQVSQNDKGKTKYSFQIQSSNGVGGPSIPHEQLLSEGLLQSILSAIEQPNGQTVRQNNVQGQFTQSVQNGQFAQGVQNGQFAQSVQNSQFAQNNVQHGQLTQGVHSGQLAQGLQNSQFTQNNGQNGQFTQNNVQNGQFTQNNEQNGQFAQNVQKVEQFAQTVQNGQFVQNGQNGQFAQNNAQIVHGIQLPPNAQFQQNFTYQPIGFEGIALPDGYEPIDRTKQNKDQDTQPSIKVENHRGDIPDCDLKVEHSIPHPVIVPPPLEKVKPVEEIDENDVAIFFDQKEDKDPVTEISVATSISENVENNEKFGDKIKKN